MNKKITLEEIIKQLESTIEEVKSENFESVNVIQKNIEDFFKDNKLSSNNLSNLKKSVEELQNQINLKITNFSDKLEENHRNNENISKYIFAKKLGAKKDV